MAMKPIRTKSDYRRALEQAGKLMMATLDTPEGDMLDELITHIESYESKHYSLDSPESPVKEAH